MLTLNGPNRKASESVKIWKTLTMQMPASGPFCLLGLLVGKLETEELLHKSSLNGASGWLSWVSIRLQLRSRSHGSRVQAPRQALC